MKMDGWIFTNWEAVFGRLGYLILNRLRVINFCLGLPGRPLEEMGSIFYPKRGMGSKCECQYHGL